MIDSQHDEMFDGANRSMAPKLLAAAAALLVTALVFTGYALLRKRHAQTSAALVATTPGVEQHQPPKALITIDEALLQGGNSLLAGTVRNTSNEKLAGLSVELELRRRRDGGLQTQLVSLEPSELEPQQEARYSLQLKAQDYSSAKLVSLKAGPGSVTVPYSTAQGAKRPAERIEPKTIIVGKPAPKGGEFLNTPDKPARVP
jgi:hypothetical protein